MDVKELQRSLDAARETSDVRAIVVINPGNPTGQVREGVKKIEFLGDLKKKLFY